MLFENNNFINYKGLNDEELSFFGLINEEKEDKIFSLNEGFEKGNMFKDIYDYYMNDHVQHFKPNNFKEKLIYDIYALDFAVNDLALYLDIYPNDKKIFKKFKDYSRKYQEKVDEYEKNYGPLNLTSTEYPKYKWIENPWPWDKSGGMYNV